MELRGTFVHISDLHVGEIDSKTGNAKVPTGAGRIIRNIPNTPFEGLLGHQGRSLEDLAHFVRTNRPAQGHFQVLVTGDYTRYGAAAEISLAFDYLKRVIDIYPPRRRMVGLLLRKDPPGIPGNHDHWAGSPFPVTPTASLFPGLGGLPGVVGPIPLTHKRALVIGQIDSDADVQSRSPKRLLAVGSFTSQLSALAQRLGANVGNDVRVLMVHHSWQRTGLTLSMDSASKAALEQFLVAHDIRAVLTGHTHQPLTVPIPGTPASELCCGTTTQMDSVPYLWKTVLGTFPGMRNWPINTLMVHKIYEDATGVLEWVAETYWRSKSAGFQLSRVPAYRFNL